MEPSVNDEALRRVLSLWSPILLGLASLCSESPTGPADLEPGTFQLSVTGEAAVDDQIYGVARRSVARVDSTDDGTPVFRHRIRLTDADTGAEVGVLFVAVGSAVDTLEIVAADSAATAGPPEPGAAVVEFGDGSLTPSPASVEAGTLMITSQSRVELGGRIRFGASVGDSVRRRSMHLDGRFRAGREDGE